ncbi:MAG: AbrB/MazE/SpoVT family DNA-binding domain-containing protein [Proteobacteria bacterium]|mgnify:CR=1 FL=1|nr:AbrB/MazE/SpoVT family DNA-binding domain-containing protein [Pseudomonadota bacterium]
MNAKLKITTIGNSAGVILPRELLAKLRVDKGDSLYVTELPDGIKLMPFDPDFAAKMEVAESIMRRRRNLLRRLADS